MGAGAPADDVLERLRTWLDRLVSALTRIVANLSGARVHIVLDLGRR